MNSGYSSLNCGEDTDSIQSQGCFNIISFLKEPLICGLKNESYFCYMNAMVQAAASSKVLIKDFKSLKSQYPKCISLDNFLNLLRGINNYPNSSKGISKNTKLLENLIKSIGWNKPSQQDVFDLFTALIKNIHEDFVNHEITNFQIPMKIKLVHRFIGMNIPDHVQNHLGLSVGLCGEYSKKPGAALKDLIKEHFSATIIDEDPSKATQMFYQQIPNVLLIHIQANKFDQESGEMVKPEYYIKYDMQMTLSLDIIYVENAEPRQVDATYQLRAIVEHIGNISGGHYITYRSYKKKWYKIDDEKVEKTGLTDNIIPYIMIYENIKTIQQKSKMFKCIE